jgi:hypothetical protein
MAIFYSLLALSGLISTAYCLPPAERSTTQTLNLKSVSPGLPQPTSSPSIIALGVGTQNYTCNSTTGTYSSNVAVADLYDITNLVQSNTKDSLSKLYLKNSQDCNADDNPLQLNHVGLHYFNGASQPNFDFTKSGHGWLQAKKGAGVPAPNSASKGIEPYKNGAVDWLYLLDNGAGVSQQLQSVYRAWTAGGKPPATCSGNQQVQVPYAAEYWFYTQTF